MANCEHLVQGFLYRYKWRTYILQQGMKYLISTEYIFGNPLLKFCPNNMGPSSFVNVGGTNTKGEGGSRTSVTVPIIAQYQLSLACIGR